MRTRRLLIAACTLTTLLGTSGAAQAPGAASQALAVSSVTVTIAGTSRKDPFLASTKVVHVTRLQLAEPRSPDVLEQALRPGGLAALDVTIPVTTLTSPDEGVDAHMHAALKADIHPEIRFQLRAIEPATP